MLAHIHKHFTNIRSLCFNHETLFWLDYSAALCIDNGLPIRVDSSSPEHCGKFWRYVAALEHLSEFQNLLVRKLFKTGRLLRHGGHASQTGTIVDTSLAAFKRSLIADSDPLSCLS